MSIFFREHPGYINRFLFNVVEAFTTPAQPKPAASILLNTKNFAEAVCKMMENPLEYFIRENTWADGYVNYWVMKPNK